jgi:hypothetical protein
MSRRESLNRSCLAILIIVVSGFLISLPLLYLTRVIFYNQNRNPPEDWLILCITLAVDMAIFFGLITWSYSKKMILEKFGIQTTATIIESNRCDNNEDACICGFYQYLDSTGRKHRAKFNICIHWPSNEQWELVQRGYSNGATNKVKYLRWFPFIHKIDFPI